MQTTTSQPDQSSAHRWLWRWHGYAGLFVIPFIFYMSLTGLPYVWEQELEDALHPEYRQLAPQPSRVPYQQQLDAARRASGGQPLLLVKLDGRPEHATQFMFGHAKDPLSVFVNPSTGEVITQFREWTRLSFAAISLHGLVFMEPYGSWLLELLACWGIILCISGVYLWWPRGRSSKLWGVFLPRLRSDGRTRWRDLHAVTGFYFAGVLAFYLFTGLPWTAFWGRQVLTPLQDAIGQSYPHCMTADAGMQSTPPASGAKPLPLDAFVEFGLKQNLPGYLQIELPVDPAGTVHLQNSSGNSMNQSHYQLDAYTAQPVGGTSWPEVPITQQAVALGIDLHEGSLLGLTTKVISTGLACIFMLMSAAAMIMWWKRRPQGRLDWPKRIEPVRPPILVRIVACLAGTLMPLFGASLVLLLLLQRLSREKA